MKAQVVTINDHEYHNSTEVGIYLPVCDTYLSKVGFEDVKIIRPFNRTKDIRKVIKEFDVSDEFEIKILDLIGIRNRKSTLERYFEQICAEQTEGSRHFAR